MRLGMIHETVRNTQRQGKALCQTHVSVLHLLIDQWRVTLVTGLLFKCCVVCHVPPATRCASPAGARAPTRVAVLTVDRRVGAVLKDRTTVHIQVHYKDADVARDLLASR